MVTLPLAMANDACEGPVAVTNDRNSHGANASGWYPMGSTVVTFTAHDSLGHTSTCQTTVTVRDTTPPVVTVVAIPNLLWPPNHWMRMVFTLVISKDACDPAQYVGFLGNDGGGYYGGGGGDGHHPFEVDPAAGDPKDPLGGHGNDNTPQHPSTPHILLTSVTSNEPNLHRDIQGASIGTPDFIMYLRAERDSHGTGRIYTITYKGIDNQGNSGYGSALVKVPLNLRDYGHHGSDHPNSSDKGDRVDPGAMGSEMP
jgi:hypothetical protein